jgi:hypothetical protein
VDRPFCLPCWWPVIPAPPLPGLDVPFLQKKKGMQNNVLVARQIAEKRGAPDLEFPFQMLNLEQQLPAVTGNALDDFKIPYFSCVERVAASNRFIKDSTEIGGNGRNWLWMGTKTFKLRMPPVARCFPLQDLLCKQSFPPEGNQALRIEISGMERPESHKRLGCGNVR